MWGKKLATTTDDDRRPQKNLGLFAERSSSIDIDSSNTMSPNWALCGEII
jgi:hypothetical protein